MLPTSTFAIVSRCSVRLPSSRDISGLVSSAGTFLLRQVTTCLPGLEACACGTSGAACEVTTGEGGACATPVFWILWPLSVASEAGPTAGHEDSPLCPRTASLGRCPAAAFWTLSLLPLSPSTRRVLPMHSGLAASSAGIFLLWRDHAQGITSMQASCMQHAAGCCMRQDACREAVRRAILGNFTCHARPGGYLGSHGPQSRKIPMDCRTCQHNCEDRRPPVRGRVLSRFFRLF